MHGEPHPSPDAATSAAPVRLWRSVDWRFLLPPGTVSSVGYPGTPPEDERRVLEELGIAVSSGGGHDDVDVLIVSSGDECLGAGPAARGTVPGGTWVLVRLSRDRPWRRLGRGSVNAARARLHAQGLQVTAAYWEAPDRTRPSFLVRLDDRLAVSAMLRRYHGVRFGLAKSLAARLVNRLGGVGLIARDVTLVARWSTEPPAATEPEPPSLLPRAEERALVGGRGLPSRLVVTPWFEASRHVIGLYFDPATGSLCGVAKVPRRPWDTSGIDHEGRVLRELSELTDALVDRVPVVREVARGERPYLLETPLSGTAAGPELVRADPERLTRAALDFLGRLPSTGLTTEDPSWFGRLVEEPLRELAARVRLDAVPPLVESTLRHLEPLRSATMPMVLEHGDLSHPNLLVHDGRLAAMDWERSEPRGLPAHDLSFFLQYVSECRLGAVERPDQLRAFDDGFTGPDAWALPWLRRYASSVPVDDDLLPMLVLTTWARSSAGLAGRLAPAAHQDQGAGPDGDVVGLAEAFEADRDFALWQHAVRRFDRILG